MKEAKLLMLKSKEKGFLMVLAGLLLMLCALMNPMKAQAAESNALTLVTSGDATATMTYQVNVDPFSGGLDPTTPYTGTYTVGGETKTTTDGKITAQGGQTIVLPNKESNNIFG